MKKVIPMVAGVAVAGVGAAKAETVLSGGDRNRFDSLFKKYESGGVDWIHLKAFAKIESDCGLARSVAHGLVDPRDIEGSKSSDGKSWGIMQLRPSTANDYESVSIEDLNNAEINIRIASKHIKRLYLLFKGNWDHVVQAYNQGEGNMQKQIRGEIAGNAREYLMKYNTAYNNLKLKGGIL